MKWFMTSKESGFFKEQDSYESLVERKDESFHTVEITKQREQSLRGFGGCFNELGYLALDGLNKEKRREIFEALFTEEGLNLNFSRIPIGASDYAQSWYSLNETTFDFAMEHFSLERDQQYLIPYIKEAMSYKHDMQFFASPWSPPLWMKTHRACNYGTLRMEPEILRAYALYFLKFITSYAEEGIPVSQIHVQNEPFADQKFPSCLFKAEEFRIFIRDYLGPLLEKENAKCDIFLGTLNGPEEMSFTPHGMKLDSYNRYLDTILFDTEAVKYIKGVGYQWAGRHVISKTRESFPDLELIQTENECGEGDNSWEYAGYMFQLMRHYFKNGVTAYTYWNMILAPGGVSTWGWKQNCMITVDAKNQEVTYNPEYYVMKHYSHFIKPGAVRLNTKGHFNSVATVFENPDASKVLVLQNALDRAEKVTIIDGDKRVTLTLPPESFHTFVWE